MQVHVRLRPCFGSGQVSCICAVVFRENNNILGLFACGQGQPPIPVRYLVDPLAPADGVTVSRNGRYYSVLPSFFICSKTVVQHATSQSIMSRTTRLNKALTVALYTWYLVLCLRSKIWYQLIKCMSASHLVYPRNLYRVRLNSGIYVCKQMLIVKRLMMYVALSMALNCNNCY